MRTPPISNPQACQTTANVDAAFDVSALSFCCKTFAQLTTAELHAIYALRQQVFVVEQNCPYNDIDGLDLCSWHVFALDDSGRALATCRIMAAGAKYVEASIGRVVAAQSVRMHGVGRLLMQKAIAQLAQLGFSTIRIGAQQRLQAFYESLGFVCVSAPYLEDDIVHIEMLKT